MLKLCKGKIGIFCKMAVVNIEKLLSLTLGFTSHWANFRLFSDLSNQLLVTGSACAASNFQLFILRPFFHFTRMMIQAEIHTNKMVSLAV